MAGMVTTTPPALQGPTAKEKKYDRQLRLWAAAGQQALEEANIVLINNAGPSVVGIETLKNLILPGVGNFTILDDRKVEEKDLGVNFFLSEDSLGKSRAEECCRYLQELNPEVQGTAKPEDIGALLRDGADFLDQYSLIILIGPQNHAEAVDLIAKQAAIKSIPLFYVQTAGFYSCFSVQLPSEFPVVDTHPDLESTQDLRLLNPWPELLDFMKVKTAKLDEIADHEHGHIPYVLLLLYFLERWKETYRGNAPLNYKEKSEFRKMVQAAARTNNPEGGEENFDEAANAVLKSLNPLELSSGLRGIFTTAKETQIDSSTPNFWIIALAISEFHSTYGVLPLSGSLPDMKAQSADYVQLQNIYKAKARADFQIIDARVHEMQKPLLVAGRPGIPRPEIEAFCKNAASVKLVHGSPLRTSSDSLIGERAKFLAREIQDEDSLVSIYLSFLLLLRQLHSTADIDPHTRDSNDHIVDAFLASLHQQSSTPLSDQESTTARLLLINTLNELTRGSGGGGGGGDGGDSRGGRGGRGGRGSPIETNELHNIAALTGGMVAQEVIKVVTKQYVPIEDTCVFDGIRSRVQVFRG